jgi:lipopolysaccharide exporter
VSEPLETDEVAGHTIKRAFAWSLVNSIVLRIGGFAAGIVVARLVAPNDFGIFAVALTVQTILSSFADLGISADLIRNGRIRERAPTATTAALITTALLALGMASTAGPVAAALGGPQATTIIRVMALTLVLNGLSVVPYALLQRDFRQKAVFGTELVSFGVSTVITIALLMLGMGPMALAVARVVSQAAVTVLQYALTKVKPRLGFNRDVFAGLLRFGVPVAAANSVSWLVMNLDYVIVGALAGAVILGFYLLAFNISSWPMVALGMAIRSIALPAFSRLTGARREASLGSAIALSWSTALLVGILLAGLAPTIITTVYGERWLSSAQALAGLAYFGALRVVIDLMATYMVAAGATRAVLLVQLVWLVGLGPAMYFGVRGYGLAGAGWAHVVAAGLVVLPAYLVALRSTGTRLRPLIRPMLIPLLAAVPAVVVTMLLARWMHSLPILALFVAAAAGTVVYVAPQGRWLLRRYRELRGPASEQDPVVADVTVATVH